MMQQVLPPRPALMTLPSDQDASGRTLGADEIALVTQAIESGTLSRKIHGHEL